MVFWEAPTQLSLEHRTPVGVCFPNISILDSFHFDNLGKKRELGKQQQYRNSNDNSNDNSNK
eukprot:m.63420 g.63420  ORF g.63420 m.63420 type:complete len:62 (-) comp19458_c0_seq4:20-205(-)